MTRLADLGTLDRADQRERVKQKHEIPTRSDERADKDRSSAKAWRECCRKVDLRDGDICQSCGCTTVRSLKLQPKRGEHAHIVRRRKEAAIMFDPRNVFKACHECHTKFDRHQLRIEQHRRDYFEYGGVAYVNADKPMRFLPTATS
jgi:hypothetical protein